MGLKIYRSSTNETSTTNPATLIDLILAHIRNDSRVSQAPIDHFFSRQTSLFRSTASFNPGISSNFSTRKPFATLSDASSGDTDISVYSAQTDSTRAEGSSVGGQSIGSTTRSHIASYPPARRARHDQQHREYVEEVYGTSGHSTTYDACHRATFVQEFRLFVRFDLYTCVYAHLLHVCPDSLPVGEYSFERSWSCPCPYLGCLMHLLKRVDNGTFLL